MRRAIDTAVVLEFVEPCRYTLRRTLRIAFVVGIVLTAINQGDVIVGGDATAGTLAKASLNFVVPFIVSNLGVISAARAQR